MTGPRLADPGNGAEDREPARDPLPVRAVVGLYPRRWRDRYGEEFAAMLSDLTAGTSWLARLGLLTDAARGAADARFNLTGGPAVADRIRGSLGVVACTLVVFVIAGAGFQKMTENAVFRAAARQHPAIGASFNILRAAAIAAGVAVLAGALPLLWSLIRQAFGSRRRDLLRLLAVPPLAIAAWLDIALFIARVFRHPQVHSAANIAVAAFIFLLGAAVAACCAWSAVAILRQAELADRLIRRQVIPLAALTACMAVVTSADISWGLAVRADDRPLFHSGNGLMSTSLPPSWAGVMVMLAAATTVTAWTTVRTARQLLAAPPASRA